jgi:pimeloyl-ACP methyl ester carboxylesterase
MSERDDEMVTGVSQGRMDETVVNGWPLKICRKGNGAPILVLHGEDEGPAWLPWMDRAAEMAEIIVPEHPGFGDTDPPRWMRGIHDLAYFYLDAIKAMELSNLHLVGFSLGGWAAAEMAIRSTSALASLTLVGASGIQVPGVAGADPFLGDEEQRTRDLFFDAALAEQFLAGRDDPDRLDRSLRQQATRARLTWRPRNYDPELARWLHRIDVPTFLIWGADDRFVPREHAVAFAERISGADITILPACGHLPQIEQPEALVERLSRVIGMEGTGR